MMNRFKLLILISCVLLLSSKANAQLSPLFQTPSLGLNLPNFNPAFVGDFDSHRFYLMNTTLRPRSRSLTNNTSSIFGYDGKTAFEKSNFQFTYGASIIYNQVGIAVDTEDNIAMLPTNVSNLIFEYGTGEIILGGRLAIGRNRDLKKKSKTKKKITLDPEQSLFLAPINDSWICSNNSSLDYIAVNFALDYNFSSLKNESGLILGNQINPNQVGSATPFNINGNVNDPSVPNGALLNSSSVDLGAGILYHKVLSNTAVLRLGYSIRNITGGFIGVPRSAQQSLPLQVYQVNFKKLFNKSREYDFNLIYIQQSKEIFDLEVSQTRFEIFRKFNKKAFTRAAKERFRLVSLEPGLSFFLIRKKNFQENREKNKISIPTVSTFFGFHFQSFKKGKSVPIYQGGTKNNVTDYLLFFSWDFHTTADLPFRETSGNVRAGLTIGI